MEDCQGLNVLKILKSLNIFLLVHCSSAVCPKGPADIYIYIYIYIIIIIIIIIIIYLFFFFVWFLL